MVSLNTLRTKFGVLLSVVIGGALLAFIFSLRDDVGFSGNDPKVGEIDGDKVNYSEFNAAYNEIRTLMGGDNVDYDQSAQIVAEAWRSLKGDHVIIPGYKSLGLVVAEAEFEAMKRGEIASGVYSSLFADPATGVYSIDAVNMFIEQAKANPEMYNIWKLLGKQARIERVSNKYMDLVRGGAYANALTLNKGVAAANNTYKGSFVVCNYTTIADSLVTVSEREIKNYYKANLEKYKQAPYRTLKYAHFEVEPTDADKKAVENEAKTNGALFAKSANLKGYVRDEVHATMGNTYVSASSLSDDEAAALRAGKTFGPELQGDEWYASRVAEVRNVPKTYKLQHIVLSYSDVALADSLFNVAKKRGADFAALVAKHSLSQSAADGDVEEVEYSKLPLVFADALASARTGNVVKIESGNSIFVTKVLGVGAVERHYRLATLVYPVEASQETLRAIHKSASEFAVNAKGSIKKFDEAANAKSIMTSSMNVKQGDRNVPGLVNSLEVVRWAADAEVGEVSDLIKLDDEYVVAVVTAIDEEEYKSLESVSSQIKNTLLREKKAALLKEKMQGATLDEIAANVEGKVEKFENAKSSAYYVQGLGMEPRVLNALASVSAEKKGELLPLVAGNRGVFAVVVDDIATEEAQSLEAERVKVQADEESKAIRYSWDAIQNAIEVEDNTVLFF